MELVVFDLDGTLLDADAKLSPLTQDTLRRLAAKGIAYTVATGRALHASRGLLDGHGFSLPQVYKNGVLVWHPGEARYLQHNHLTLPEVEHVLHAVLAQRITPFMFTLEPGNLHAVYHPPLQTDAERRLVADFRSRSGVEVLPASQMPADAEISNISALGAAAAVEVVEQMIADEPNLVAYAGTALEGAEFNWIDIHHVEASKGNAVIALREALGFERVVCFGDSLNDLSMFAAADEAYAPSNAKPELRAAATAVIGHHDQDGVAQFLRERFELDVG